ncbi:MAG: helical backbone metal receptor [Betaproteobacteria bacterium]|nr:helical backbone metal receptor [Betaproteobacteria bacterium]
MNRRWDVFPVPRRRQLFATPCPRFFAALALAIGVALWPFFARAAVELRDDRDTLVRLPAPAQRIVALAPNLTELAYAAGAGQRLVGVASFSDYPAAARRVTHVGDAARVDIERIVSLKPDLVLAWKSGNQAGDIDKLARLGYAVFVTEPVRLADIPRLLRTIGALAGTAPAAERAARAFKEGVQSLRTRYTRARKVRAFYEVWHRPLITVSDRHMIGDVISLCGGQNVFADAPGLTPTVSLEAVVVAGAEAVLGGARSRSEADFRRQWRQAPLAVLRSLPAFYVDPDLIQRQTPRILEGTRVVCAALDTVRSNATSDKRR